MMRLPLSDDTRTIVIDPKAAMSRLSASNNRYIIFIDDGGIPIVGKDFPDEEDGMEFLSRMFERWYGEQ